jgi:hypothetical protein
MPFCEPLEALYSMKASGRVGRPNSCGEAWCGWSQCGEDNDLVAVYQQRRKRIGNNHAWRIGDPKPRNFRMRHTWPSNDYHANRQLWRERFASAVLGWQNLTAFEKAYYNTIAKKKGRFGYHYFIEDYLDYWYPIMFPPP